MNKEQKIEKLQTFRDRLTGKVSDAYKTKGNSYGKERFNSWRNQFEKFLKDELPGEEDNLKQKLNKNLWKSYKISNSSYNFWQEDSEKMISYIDSLILDIKNDEYESPKESDKSINSNNGKKTMLDKNSIFIVHGHNVAAKEQVARFVEKLGFDAIILHEQVSGGKTIIEKIKSNTNVGFAIVLYTPDDFKDVKTKSGKNLKPRARQNVVFEHGYLIAKIGRENVTAVVFDDVELPTDIRGIVYIKAEGHWKNELAKEMKNAGYNIDYSKIS